MRSSCSGETMAAVSAEPVKSNAKNRRERENNEFAQLAHLLPLPSAITSQLDKASIIRLTKSYLHLTDVFPQGFSSNRLPMGNYKCTATMTEASSHLMQTLEGFVFMADPCGKIMYISETASVHLGMSQVELIGNSLYEYVHENDHTEVSTALNPSAYGENEERMFFLRIRCVLPKRNAGLTDHGYKVIHCSGSFKHQSDEDASVSHGEVGLIAIGYPLPLTAATEIRLSSFMFMFRTTADLKIVFLDSRASDLTGYDLQALLDRSLYGLIHTCDTKLLVAAHRTVLEKQQATTQYFRFLTKHGGWLWMQAQMTMVAVPRAVRPPCVLFICSVIGFRQPEMSDLILSTDQRLLKWRKGGSVIRGSELELSTMRASKGDADKSAVNFVGAYSEAFYGQYGMHLVQQQARDGKYANTTSQEHSAQDTF